MRLLDVNCAAIDGLLFRWYDGQLDGVEADVFEQHVLLCPPCQVQNGKLRTAMSALPAAARVPAPPGLVERLVALAGSEERG